MRRSVTGHLQWLDGTQRMYTSASTVLLFAACNQVEVALAGREAQRLGLYDCLRLEGTKRCWSWMCRGGAA